jgi:hypothetical protein
MRFIDNWCYALTDELDSGADELPIPGEAIARLDLAEGDEYVLCIVGALDPLNNSALEVVRLVGLNTGYELQRGEQGTSAQTWPAGSVVHCGVTAALVAELWQAAQSGGGGGAGLTLATEPPSDTPSTVGELYLDVMAPALFAAVDTGGWGWQQLGGGRYMQRISDDGSETLNPIERWARDVQVEADVYEFGGVIRLRLPPLAGGLGALEHMRLEVINPDSPGWQLQLDCSDIADRLGLSAFQFDIAGADAVADGNMLVTMDFTDSHTLHLAVGLLSADGSDRTALVRVEATPRPNFVGINSPISW